MIVGQKWKAEKLKSIRIKILVFFSAVSSRMKNVKFTVLFVNLRAVRIRKEILKLTVK